MKLTTHIIPIDINNEEKLIINSLNGIMDKVGQPIFDIIQRWYGLDEITPETEVEVALYNNLKSRGYLVNNHDEEMTLKNQVISRLREIHNKQKENCKHITFIMTYNCNFRCPYCFEGESTVKREIINPEQIDAALRLAGDSLESVGLFGGEPLLPSNRASLEYLFSKTKGKVFNITTNGYYLEEYLDLLSQLNVAYIMVTLDGEEETHNSRRYLANGKPTYDKIMRGIEKYLENGIPIRIRMNLDSNNFTEGQKLQQNLVEKFRAYEKHLSFEMGTIFGIPNDEKTEITTQLFNQGINLSPEEKQQNNTMIGRFSPIVNNMTIGSKLKPTYSFCSAHSNIFLVDPYGLIYTCLPAVGKQELSVGTYHPELKFKENSIYTRNIETIPECRECTYSLLCGGGCPLGLPSYEDVCKPECFSIRNQVHNLLPRFYNMNCEAEKKRELSQV